MSHTIQLSDESAELLERQAAAHGLTVAAWVQMLARERARAEHVDQSLQKAIAAADRILQIQKRSKADPDGWTSRVYIDHGRC